MRQAEGKGKASQVLMEFRQGDPRSGTGKAIRKLKKSPAAALKEAQKPADRVPKKV